MIHYSYCSSAIFISFYGLSVYFGLNFGLALGLAISALLIWWIFYQAMLTVYVKTGINAINNATKERKNA